jgi:hypothetical protein
MTDGKGNPLRDPDGYIIRTRPNSRTGLHYVPQEMPVENIEEAEEAHAPADNA